MASFQDIVDLTKAITVRPDLTIETAFAVRDAILRAHRAHKFWKDLSVVTVSPSNGVTQIQNIPMTDLPSFRALAYIKDPDSDTFYQPVDISDLLDADNLARTDVCWGAGASISIRARNPLSSYEIAYYRFPVYLQDSSSPIGSWIAEAHPDLIAALASLTVLGMIGEQEIRGRMEQLVAMGMTDLAQDNITLT